MSVTKSVTCEVQMDSGDDARECVDSLRDAGAFIRLGWYKDGRRVSSGTALVIDEEHQIGVMVTDCPQLQETGIPRGAFVKFVKHPEAEPKIVGRPAFAEEFAAIVLENGLPKPMNFR